MGCVQSSAAEPEALSGGLATPRAATKGILKMARERLAGLEGLDEQTKIPFILVELTGEEDGQGEIEICGKDEYAVYSQLGEWLEREWECEQLDPGDLSDASKIPFCKAQYRWPGYHKEGEEGLNNMGKCTMQLIDFMCGQLSWTLAVSTGGNVGEKGDIREQQIIFKAPHPMNLSVPHMMIEIRSAGYIEVCADLDADNSNGASSPGELRRAGMAGDAKTILNSLECYLADRFKAEPIEGHEQYCDRYYKAGEGVFQGSPGGADSNFGLLTTDLCDRIVVGFPGWSLVAANSGSYGEQGEHQEQQLIFRRDEHPLGDSKYLLAVINSNGTVEVNGAETADSRVHNKVERFLKQKWGCKRPTVLQEGDTISKTFKWEPKDMMVAITEMVTFFEKMGWEMQVCSQQAVKEEGEQCMEQQLFFREGKTAVGTVEPHIFLEIYAGEGDEELYQNEEMAQVLANQYLRVEAICDKMGQEHVDRALQDLDEFVLNLLKGQKEECDSGAKYSMNVFMCRGFYENNLAQWVMRVCDFLVDRLGWSFMVCSQCNKGERGQLRLQQLVFRFDGDKRNLPVSRKSNNCLDPAALAEVEFPEYWKAQEVLNGDTTQKVVQCSGEERDALQIMLDSTFKRVLTRDRQPDDDALFDEEMPYCLDVVSAFRSEHAHLYHRYMKKRGEAEVEEPFDVKTNMNGTVLTERLPPGDAYLLHGTNPSSAMSILKTGFVLDHAGSTTGMMYGPGVYTAECSSKSDEYGRDDGGNTYPSLCAMLVCRCFVGKPYVVDSAGDRVNEAIEAGLDCVCGDRETKVGTYREFIFFDEAQVFPEYVVIYRRQYESPKAPMALRGIPTTGTTGRFWQIKEERGRGVGWKNVPPEINRMLIQASRSGQEEVSCFYLDTEFVFNLTETKRTDTTTGSIKPLRAPMVS